MDALQLHGLLHLHECTRSPSAVEPLPWLLPLLAVSFLLLPRRPSPSDLHSTPICSETPFKITAHHPPNSTFLVSFSPTFYIIFSVNSAESFSHVWLFVTPWTTAYQASLSITNFWSLLKLMCIESVMPSNHLIACHPLLLLPSIFPSIKVFYNELVLHIRWPKYWNFSFSINSSNEYSELISFRIDWFDLLAVQRTIQVWLKTNNLKLYSGSDK